MHHQGHHCSKGPQRSSQPNKASLPPPQQPIPAPYPVTNTTSSLWAIAIASFADQYRMPLGLYALDLLSAPLFYHNKESIVQIDPTYCFYFQLPRVGDSTH